MNTIKNYQLHPIHMIIHETLETQLLRHHNYIHYKITVHYLYYHEIIGAYPIQSTSQQAIDTHKVQLPTL